LKLKSNQTRSIFMSKYVVNGKKAIETKDEVSGLVTIDLPEYTRSRHYLDSWVSHKTCEKASFEMVTCPVGIMKKQFKYILVDNENKVIEYESPQEDAKVGKSKKQKPTIHTREFELKINKPFLMSNTPITQGVWEYVMNYNDSYYQESTLELHLYGYGAEKEIINAKLDTDLNRPVEQITWYDAVLFCNKLSELQGLEPFYKMSKIEYDENLSPDRFGNQKRQPMIQASELHIVYAVVDTNEHSNGYRLPTKVEWDYAFLADGKGRIGGYDGLLQDVAWSSYAEKDTSKPFFNRIDDNPLFENSFVNIDQKFHFLCHTYPVKNKKPNAWGFYDMIGNVSEWIFDNSLRQAVTKDNIKKQPLGFLLSCTDGHKESVRITKEKLELLIEGINSLKQYVIKPTRKFTRSYEQMHQIKGEAFDDQSAPTLYVIIRGSSMPAHKALPNIGFRVVRNIEE